MEGRWHEDTHHLKSRVHPESAAAQDIDRLDDHLRFLEPLMGHRWEGGEWVPGHIQEFRAKTQGGR
jgi:hypothetical protein